MTKILVTKIHSIAGNHYQNKKCKKNYGARITKSMILLLRLSLKMDQFVFVMREDLDSRSRPTAKSCNAAIAVKGNTSDSESTKLLNFDCSILLHNVGVKGRALVHQKLQ